ncbi:MAG: TolC family protein [Deltaproteobacteria bacterium]|nr:TolC family protein [Deltaproteobacteria bacterium]
MCRVAVVSAVLCVCPAMAAIAAGAERVLTLDEAVSTALTANPQIASARDTRSAATFKVQQARAGYLPSVAAVVGYKRATANSPAPPYISSSGASAAASASSSLSSLVVGREETTSYDNWSASVSLNQTIYDFGRTGGAHDAAAASEQAAAADIRSVEEHVAFSVIQAYFGVLAAQESVKAARETRRQMEKHLELAHAQVAAGVRTRIDVARAQSDVASANLAVLRAENALKNGRLSLESIMGSRTRGDYTVERPAAAAAPAIGDVEQAVKEALERRPEHRSLVEKVRSLEAALRAVRSGYYPSIAANGNLGYSGYELDGMVYNWVLGATATWNFFNGFATQNAAEETRANISAAQSAIRTLEIALRQEIESANLALGEARERMTPAQALLASAKETLELAEARYAAGAGNIVEISDAQAVYTQARYGLIQTEFDIEVARARLLKAVGRVSEGRRTE